MDLSHQRVSSKTKTNMENVGVVDMSLIEKPIVTFLKLFLKCFQCNAIELLPLTTLLLMLCKALFLSPSSLVFVGFFFWFFFIDNP